LGYEVASEIIQTLNLHERTTPNSAITSVATHPTRTPIVKATIYPFQSK